ncbi:hypothetical protein [Streptomyces sp. B29(2018)]|uniref:hypothetical protein n=1 Tax=Streptomyces sp. B29(2018) TaxID=2485016 RepID=UPI000FD635BC|nr:hypothetical protein [Streptomyces sp. B29(2018)]
MLGGVVVVAGVYVVVLRCALLLGVVLPGPVLLAGPVGVLLWRWCCWVSRPSLVSLLLFAVG